MPRLGTPQGPLRERRHSSFPGPTRAISPAGVGDDDGGLTPAGRIGSASSLAQARAAVLERTPTHTTRNARSLNPCGIWEFRPWTLDSSDMSGTTRTTRVVDSDRAGSPATTVASTGNCSRTGRPRATSPTKLAVDGPLARRRLSGCCPAGVPDEVSAQRSAFASVRPGVRFVRVEADCSSPWRVFSLSKHKIHT